MLTGRLIGGLIKGADEVFVQVTHLGVGHLLRMQVDTDKALNYEVEDTLLRHSVNLLGELKTFEDIQIGREAINIMLQICLETGRITQQSP